MVIGFFSFLPDSSGHSITSLIYSYQALWLCIYITTALTGMKSLRPHHYS
ncbi:hypothetical protein HMPREF1152_1793 [Mogibacterium sp. CM50]|uniref:Uncharacterized protein n=1 Tax=Mogibacterium timidum ATCC 33093 TaxID=1401079 RepID=X8ISN1_9FIRM|nr:hypothetical protein HMPREF1152_1793 [Mogibacterium sp. CM50]EUC52662.1 hypothetical protein HMPREF0581_1444 [Mogibacterium timidum ATCC 33093]